MENEWRPAECQFNDVVKPELVEAITKRAGQKSLQSFDGEEDSVMRIQEHDRLVFEEIHKLSIKGMGVELREQCYNEKLIGDRGYRRLKDALDLWCSVWFWHADKLDAAPTPKSFYEPSEETRRISRELAEKLKFFHWELEYPDVFNQERHGFDAILGNPPWEISKPNSMEFFTAYDPIYRARGKQDAIQVQKKFFESKKEVENGWLLYNADFRSMSNYAKYSAHPFGDPEVQNTQKLVLKRGKDNASIHRQWRKQRAKHTSYSDAAHPYIHLGSADLNTYKMFLETSHMLLSDGRHLGMIVPSGIYTDQGSTDLRKLFMEGCQWAWLFGFENRKKIFDIDSRFKFCPVVIVKGGKTDEINTAFMRHDLADWETPKKYAMHYKHEQIGQFSPINRSLLEIRSQRDLEILDKIYRNSVMLGDTSEKGWKVKYANEFHMTNDSKLFPPITRWIEQCYKPDPYGRWIGPNGDMALPLYEGRMIGQFDFSAKGWVSGKGRSAVWREIPFGDKRIEPQYLITSNAYSKWEKAIHGYKVGFMDVTSATNARTMISCLLVDEPCGNKVPILDVMGGNFEYSLALVSIFNSFSFDYVLRNRLGGITLNFFILEEMPIHKKDRFNKSVRSHLSIPCSKLIFTDNKFAIEWLRINKLYPKMSNENWKSLWAITTHERLRLRCILDAIVAELYGLSYDDFAYILRDDPSDPKGFWRVDKDKPKELRHTTLALLAFKRLKEVGLEEFCDVDWQFPPDIQEKLGPRFLPWQLEGTPEESWKECEMHARNLGEDGYGDFANNTSDTGVVHKEKSEQRDRRTRKTTLLEWSG